MAPDDALARLVEGNRRFREGRETVLGRSWHEKLAEGQRPFAIVLGCSDSRTPVEILFDQGFGELFVVRVAGNIAGPSVLGSIEFAAAAFGTRLVLVMGHTRCGGVAETVRTLETPGLGLQSKNLRAITDRIAPHVEPLLAKGLPREELLLEALKANVRAQMDQLRHGSELLEELVSKGRLAIAGSYVELETGVVHLL